MTVPVVKVKVLEVDPAATSTEAGTVADPEFDERVTREPPVGALEVSVTVPVTCVPPITDNVDRESDLIEGRGTAGVIERLACAEVPP